VSEIYREKYLGIRITFIPFESTCNYFGVLQILTNVGFDVFLQSKTSCSYIQFVKLDLAKQNVQTKQEMNSSETRCN
jgi:hypothetical protein